jgi:DNA-binding transcriptional regulator YhcF (GntR family)
VRIDHESSAPLYVQLAGLLRSQIEDGTITKRLPSVKTLSREHGVSYITGERVLTTLKDDGLIVPVIGKGYYVAGTSARPLMFSQRRYSASAALHRFWAPSSGLV